MVKLAMFLLGGGGYVGLELLWRGRSHGSMFAAGGLCFLILGVLEKKQKKLWRRGLLGAASITAVELATGLLVNRDYGVWDYRALPVNFLGQVCLPFTALWVPLSLVGMALYPKAEGLVKRKIWYTDAPLQPSRRKLPRG